MCLRAVTRDRTDLALRFCHLIRDHVDVDGYGGSNVGMAQQVWLNGKRLRQLMGL